MRIQCACGEPDVVADRAAAARLRCRRCGRLLARKPWILRNAGTLPYAGLAALAIGVLAGLVNIAYARADDSADGSRLIVRTETIPAESSDGAVGRGVLKVINESGTEMALRLIGPEYSDSHTILVPAWRDGRVFGLAPGKWVVKYCKGSGWQPGARRFASTDGCAELDETIDYRETLADETMRYGAVVVRFGPSSNESPAAHAIAAEDFASD